MKIVGYGICGPGEADRYMEATACKSFKALCDETIILGNNITDKERELIKKYKFHLVEDNREWGKAQNLIKEDFIRNHVSKLNPDATICLDMDEELITTREQVEEHFTRGNAWYVYIANLWEDGYRSDWSFSNVRMWSWAWKEKLGEGFYKFENRPVHCGLAPKWCYQLNLHSSIMLLHYGLKKKEDRQKKLDRYAKYDPNRAYRDPRYYEALEEDYCEPFDQAKLQRLLDTDISKIKQPLNKELPMQPRKTKEYMIVREFDGLTFPVNENLLHSQLKQQFKGMGFKLIEELEVSVAPAPEILAEPLECLICGFIGKTQASLKGHKTKTGHQ